MDMEEIIAHVRANQSTQSSCVILFEDDINNHPMKVEMFTDLTPDDCCGEVYFSVHYMGMVAQYTDLNYAIEKVLKSCGS